MVAVEGLLVQQLGKLPALSGKVRPVTALESDALPYCVYVVTGRQEASYLGGWLGSWTYAVDVHIVAQRYGEMKQLANNAVEKLKELEGTEGIQEIRINEPQAELYERELDAYRKVIELNIWI